MPFDLGAGGSVWLAAVVLVAAFVRGYSGFGYSALVIAGSALVTSPLNLVAVVMFLEFVMSAQSWRGAGPDIDWRRVLLLMLGAAVGLPLGLWALTAVPEDTARAAISGPLSCPCFGRKSGLSEGAKPAGRPTARICHNSPCAISPEWSSAPRRVVKPSARKGTVSTMG